MAIQYSIRIANGSKITIAKTLVELPTELLMFYWYIKSNLYPSFVR